MWQHPLTHTIYADGNSTAQIFPTVVHLIMQYPVNVQALAGTASKMALHPTLGGGIAGIEEHADGALMQLLRHDGQCRSVLLCAGDEKELFGGTRLLRLGGHFPGSAVLHWAAGSNGQGVLCTGARLCSAHR